MKVVGLSLDVSGAGRPAFAGAQVTVSDEVTDAQRQSGPRQTVTLTNGRTTPDGTGEGIVPSSTPSTVATPVGHHRVLASPTRGAGRGLGRNPRSPTPLDLPGRPGAPARARRRARGAPAGPSVRLDARRPGLSIRPRVPRGRSSSAQGRRGGRRRRRSRRRARCSARPRSRCSWPGATRCTSSSTAARPTSASRTRCTRRARTRRAPTATGRAAWCACSAPSWSTRGTASATSPPRITESVEADQARRARGHRTSGSFSPCRRRPT